MKNRRLLIGLTVSYLALVAFATLGPTWVVSGALDLFRGMTELLPGSAPSPSSLEFAANVAMFVPLGMLLLLLAGPRRWWLALLLVFGLTASIELVQAGIPSRVSDLRDVFANTGGGALGIVLGVLATLLRRRVALLGAAGVVALGAVLLSTTGGMVAPPLARAETGHVAAQLDYVGTYWNSRNAGEYGALDTTDCVNFASQTLIARGWEQTDQWWHRRSPDGHHSYSDAWISSTALRDYLAGKPELATVLDASARDRVTPGDLVQFDWDSNGRPDHTGIVVSVADEGSGAVIRYASHSNDRERQGVDEALAKDGRGGSYSFWHLVD
ncbi:hypothetical protein EYE40_11080 [Glaciihabitans arcticus]|uniref:VanZ family protein n=1 Tax=Glaciihabitans arcticus TaxID=2668039 RepID=A0A4Q9GSB6_9MICO|nr:amidase domain-containing protein [Glaciihabitans arcticus]TBN57892.1 hypothetical protein EYE40_11080 [Glaciihabitans arcticus]